MAASSKPSPQLPLDALQKLLNDLSTRDSAPQEAGARAFCEYVLWETRDLRGESFTAFMDGLYERLNAMIESSDELENIAAVCAIDALIDGKLGEHSEKLSKLDTFLRYVFEEKREEATLLLAGNAFGHLLRVGNTLTPGLTAKTVDEMVTLALDWLTENNPHKLAAAIILKAVAESSPTIFNTSVPMFNEKIWIALHDENKAVRERAAEALGACLRIVQTRETRWRAQRYYRLFEQTDYGMAKQASAESIHGSLIAIRELLQGAGEFMMARYQDVANIVLRFKQHKDPLIRRTITELVPMIARYLKAKFVTEYLEKYMQYLMDVMKNPSERASGFEALGGMANRVGDNLVPYLNQITQLLRDAIAPKRGPVCPEALICVGKLAQSLGENMQKHVNGLLVPMLQAGLSPALVESLSAISSSLPDLAPDIQSRLIRLIDTVLVKETTSRQQQSTSSSAGGSVDPGNAAVIQLALSTLGSFKLVLHAQVFLDKTKKVVVYLEDSDPLIRQEAAVTSCKLIASALERKTPSASNPESTDHSYWVKTDAIIFEIVKKLMVAVIDTEPGVRKAFISCLLATDALHDFILHEDCVFPLFIPLKDEVFEIRELTIKVLGRIRNKNPAHILSRMRDHRQYLLGGLDLLLDAKTREECTKLLGVLIRNCPESVSCDYLTILEMLIEKLREAMHSNSASAGCSAIGGNCGVITSTLATLGELSKVGGSELREHLADLLPLIVRALQDDKVPGKQKVAVMTLGQVLQSTGYVASPLIDYPELLPSLERLLNPTGDWALQREVMNVWGMLGVDPHMYKHGMVDTLLSTTSPPLQSPSMSPIQLPERGNVAIPTAVDETPIDLLCSATFSTSNEGFYPTVATNALLRVVMNSATASSQRLAITSLVAVLKALGQTGCAPYLPKIMSGFFYVFRTCEDGLKGLMLEQFCEIVSIVRKPIHPYLCDLMTIILQEWSNPALLGRVQILLEKLFLAVNVNAPLLFERYMPEVLPRCMQQLADAERSGDFGCVRSTLHMLEVFTVGFSMVHVHWVVPAVVRMFKGDVCSAPVEIRREALRSLARLMTRLCKTYPVSGLVQSFFVPLIRVMCGPEPSLREEALDVLCIFAGMDVRHFSFALPLVMRIVETSQIRHEEFQKLASEMNRRRWMQIDSLKNRLLKKLSETEGVEVDSSHLGSPVRVPEEYAAPLKVDAHNLKTATEAWNLSRREDWDEWMRHLSVKLLKESPSPALRSCAELAREQPSVAKELFSAAFVSCWTEMAPPFQGQLVTWFEHAFVSPSISTETLTILLSLAEFMDRDEKPLPIQLSTLARLAEKCLTFAKTLHYREKEFHDNPAEAVEQLIHIYNRLNQHEAAVGILVYAQQDLEVHLKESWYEELHRWEKALDAYAKKICDINSRNDNVMYEEANIGRMRCLAALGRWSELNEACRENWNDADQPARLEMAPLAASAAWNMGQWDQMNSYIAVLDNGTNSNARTPTPAAMSVMHRRSVSGDGPFFKAVLAVHQQQYEDARKFVDLSRKMLLTDLAAMVSESYERAYSTTVRVQQLTELEEVIDYRLLEQRIQMPGANDPTKSAFIERLQLIKNMWKDRLRGAARDAEVWQALLSVRSLVLPPTEDLETWLKFASLCRKSGRGNQAEATLQDLKSAIQAVKSDSMTNLYQCKLAHMKHIWSLDNNVQRRDVYKSLQELLKALEPEREASVEAANNASNGVPPTVLVGSAVPLLARVYLKLGTWRWSMNPVLTEESTTEILSALKSATEVAPGWSKAWHKWALFNTAVIDMDNSTGKGGPGIRHVVAAVNGCVKSIALGSACLPHGRDHRLQKVVVLQDILRLLTLWFTYGANPEVQRALKEGFTMIKIDTWLAVIPQIIARIHSKFSAVRKLVQDLLIDIGSVHPQALMYPLLVACKSMSSSRQEAAQVVLEDVRQKYPLLVDQAQLVSEELIRMAILWHEMWHEALEEASRLYFGEKNPKAMFKNIEPYHVMLMKRMGDSMTGVPFVEEAFVQAYGHDLEKAYKCLLQYQETQRPSDMDEAWELYCSVFRRLQKQLPSLTTLDLKYVSPELKNASNLRLAVPGTYKVGVPDVTIVSFSEQLQVFTSKQRPRKLTILGSDLQHYGFLLKGHEDLRQDERVMQLFGLVNFLLADDRMTAGKDLAIQRYSVIPLAPNSGLIGWVPHCDTFHQLIREYRDARKLQVNLEHRLMTSMAVSIENLTLMGKVEVFEYALMETDGNDLAKVLWLKSRSSEMWLEHRTNYTRSLGVMSMVGYILGLGDRHPSNLMLNRHSGKVVHIDFGDCFEASMNREKFPERVPFRLTRMLIKAMEVSGIEGTYRLTCENVMQVLRNNKDSVMAMMEAFVHDPLINWRLININEMYQVMSLGPQKANGNGSADSLYGYGPSLNMTGQRRLDGAQMEIIGDCSEVLNERAVVVMNRMRNKLTGKDFQTTSSTSSSSSLPPNSSSMPAAHATHHHSRHLSAAHLEQQQQQQHHHHHINGGVGDSNVKLSAARGEENDAREEAALSVQVQVEKLIVQAMSHENLCQSFIGWCPFW